MTGGTKRKPAVGVRTEAGDVQDNNWRIAMKTSEVLDKAADLIEERGWIKGTGWPMAGGPEDAALCLEGGIAAAMGIRFAACIDDAEVAPLVTCPAYTAVVAYLDDALTTDDGRTRPLWWWNDHNVTKGAEQVIATLRAAAVIEAARESESAPTSPTPAEVSL